MVLILVDFSKAEQTISLPSALEDVLEGRTKQSVTLPVYEVAVLQAPLRNYCQMDYS